jgi:hypothetical protein
MLTARPAESEHPGAATNHPFFKYQHCLQKQPFFKLTGVETPYIIKK